jgi:hypothetical protein
MHLTAQPSKCLIEAALQKLDSRKWVRTRSLNVDFAELARPWIDLLKYPGMNLPEMNGVELPFNRIELKIDYGLCGF